MSTTVDNEETDIYHSVISGTLVGPGKANRAVVTINIVNTFDSDRNIKTEVSNAKFRCPGSED